MARKGGWYVKRAQNVVQCRTTVLIFHVLLLDFFKKRHLISFGSYNYVISDSSHCVPFLSLRNSICISRVGTFFKRPECPLAP